MARRINNKDRQNDTGIILAEQGLREAVEDILQMMGTDGFDETIYYRMLLEATERYDDIKKITALNQET